MLYQKFRRSSLDMTPLGLITGPDESDSVYTPARARMVAWGADQSFHFCQVEGFGDTVFAVDPSAPPGDCVQPVAKNLSDFIGLVITCADAELIAKAYRLSSYLFDKKRSEVTRNARTNAVLRAVQNNYRPNLMDSPYEYIMAMQENFPYDTLPLRADYFEWCPIRPGMLRWNVGFGTGFADHCEKAQAGQELRLERGFLWSNEDWKVPSIYLCDNGIVVDSYLEVPGESMARFQDKWSRREASQMSIEEQMRRKLDDPLGVEVRSMLTVNGKPAPMKKIEILRWDPTVENDWHTRRTLEHYGLDRNKAYLLRREHFLRRGKNPPIREIELSLQAEPVAVPGQRFIAPRAGEMMSFTHPATGQVHTLRVIAQTREALDPNFLSNHPCCYTRLSFSLDPQLDAELFSIVDCDPGDPFESGPEAPASALLAGKIPAAGHYALSSMRYVPADTITWRMIFRQKLRSDITIRLLP